MKSIRITAIAALLVLTVLTGCKKEDPDAISMSEVNVGATTYYDKDGNPFLGVNMGSGLIWTACNIGANSPEESGTYFAWGETATKEEFHSDNYKWLDGDLYLLKYTQNKNNAKGGEVDKKTTLDPEDDAATVILGGKWRLPSEKEYNELIHFCDIKWGTLNGVSGFLFTSKVDEKEFAGNSIFFPLSGQKDLKKIKNADKFGFYWTRQLYKTQDKEAACLWLEHQDLDNHVVQYLTRYIGMPIKAVATTY